ncbi:hypothetical protein CRE_08747 [Caenorhabditis remanei]|uniref:NR LBD domain-containing protein n=1 Tax=Caenorhabditis remanei TaxID=31234 RepID=E3LHB5_CAERE|nr:hypothetical protein CRE_08747 [Caenorhabditis remanei]
MKRKSAVAWDKTAIFLAENYKLQVAFYIEGVGDWSTFTTIQPILDLDATDVEMNYMLAQISFSYAAKELEGELSEIAEKFLQLVADDLHNYYTREMGVSRYSDRVLKMMKVNNMMTKALLERKEKMTIAKTFDIFHNKFSEPEMFEFIF